MSTVGTYLAKRLQELGLTDYFAIPGDYNLSLLDELLKNTSLQMINCCNELNAGYAADGYARVKGVSALVLTFSVGGLSAVNAVADMKVSPPTEHALHTKRLSDTSSLPIIADHQESQENR